MVSAEIERGTSGLDYFQPKTLFAACEVAPVRCGFASDFRETHVLLSGSERGRMILHSRFWSTATLFLFAIGVGSCCAQTYNAAADFESGWTAQKNPNGVWSYGYSSGFTSPVTLYGATVQNGVNGPNAQYWLAPSVDVLTSPAAEFNNGPAHDDGNINFLANEFVLVAGVGGLYSDLVFTTPTDGIYSIASIFRGDQYNIGVVVGVVVGGSLQFSSAINGEGQIQSYDTSVFLKSGEQIVFSVGPKVKYQNTGLSAVITKVPCTIEDTATYNSTANTLTTKLAIANSSAATLNIWLSYQDTTEHLFSEQLPISDQPKAFTRTVHLPKIGGAGVLSTLTTLEQGIGCSSWTQIDTGTAP
jgi:hypothetical protein